MMEVTIHSHNTHILPKNFESDSKLIGSNAIGYMDRVSKTRDWSKQLADLGTNMSDQIRVAKGVSLDDIKVLPLIAKEVVVDTEIVYKDVPIGIFKEGKFDDKNGLLQYETMLIIIEFIKLRASKALPEFKKPIKSTYSTELFEEFAEFADKYGEYGDTLFQLFRAAELLDIKELCDLCATKNAQVSMVLAYEYYYDRYQYMYLIEKKQVIPKKYINLSSPVEGVREYDNYEKWLIGIYPYVTSEHSKSKIEHI